MSEQIVTTRTAGATRRGAGYRRKRIFYTIVGIYLSLSLWFVRGLFRSSRSLRAPRSSMQNNDLARA
jgi:hypothetical protein